MSKRGKILIFLIAISLGLVLYLIFQSKIITIRPMADQAKDNAKVTTKIDEGQMEYEYKNGIRTILSDYDQLLTNLEQAEPNDPSTSTEPNINYANAKDSLADLKNRLAELKAPQKISNDAKKLTLEYLLPSFNLINSYLVTNNEKEKNEAKNLAMKIKQDFPWAIN